MDKKLNQTMMVECNICNIFLRLKTKEKNLTYVPQPSFCVTYIVSTKNRQHLNDLNLRDITDIKMSWKNNYFI